MPDAGEIAVVDLTAARQVESWTAPGLRANFPLTVDSSGTALAVVFRRPARLVLINTKTGATTQQLDTCGDADDVFFDTMRRGSMSAAAPGRVDVFQSAAAGYPLGARRDIVGLTDLALRPELDRLYIAAGAGLLGSEAAILAFRPLP